MSIGFAIPGMYENFQTNKNLLTLYHCHPECFNDNISFDAFYGNFQFCIWDGGRVFGNNYKQANLENIENIKNYFNNIEHIPIRFIFTNCKIEKKHCYDRFCNLVTEICQNDMNEIVVNSPILEEYIRKTYPKYKIISSTTKCIQNFDKVKEELNNPNYNRVCLDYCLNSNKELLESFSEKQKDKIELLINEICGIGCKNRKIHYELNSLFSLNYGKKFKMNFCEIPGSNLCLYKETEFTSINYNQIINYYYPLGIKHYKLQGRTYSDIVHAANCVKFLIKPEYQLYAISELVRHDE